MSTTTVLVEQDKYSRHIYAKQYKTDKDRKTKVKNKSYQVLRRRIFGTFIETIKSVLLIFICLLLYKITGLHAWWIHLVGQIT